MKILLCLLLNVVLSLTGICHPYIQSIGKEGNRVVGLVLKDDGTPFHAEEAIASIFRRDDVNRDSTNKDGIYCILVPKDISTFNLVYKASGYWGVLSEEYRSASDPIKVEKVLLRKKDPKDTAQLQQINKLLQTELMIYQGTASESLRREIKKELISYSNAIEIPPPDQVRVTGITEQERAIRINAQISIDNVLVKMK